MVGEVSVPFPCSWNVILQNVQFLLEWFGKSTRLNVHIFSVVRLFIVCWCYFLSFIWPEAGGEVQFLLPVFSLHCVPLTRRKQYRWLSIQVLSVAAGNIQLCGRVSRKKDGIQNRGLSSPGLKRRRLQSRV